MTATVRLANGPVSWGVSIPRTPQDPPWQSCLDGIASAGYEGTELGPHGYLPTDPSLLREELAQRDLKLAGGFIYAPLHDPASRDAVLGELHATGSLLQAVGVPSLVVMDAMSPERMATAGRADAASRLEPTAWDELLALVADLGRIATDTYGLRVAFHPHVGTYVEFADEVEPFFAALDPAEVGLCLDTGHSAFAGLDPLELCERYGDRLRHLHFKDVDPGVLSRVRAEGLDWDEAVGAGVFCDLGRGMVDFSALARRLEDTGFDGWATVEQDVEPGGKVDPGVAARRNQEFLRALGFGLSPLGGGD